MQGVNSLLSLITGDLFQSSGVTVRIIMIILYFERQPQNSTISIVVFQKRWSSKGRACMFFSMQTATSLYNYYMLLKVVSGGMDLSIIRTTVTALTVIMSNINITSRSIIFLNIIFETNITIISKNII